MNISGLKFRYINFACYEIVLPNGKTIVVDPCINMNGLGYTVDFKPEDFTGADYILLSHVHVDHTMDAEYLAKKYNSKVVVGAMSAFEFARYADLNTDQVYPVFPNEHLIFDDFRVDVYRGKHTFVRKGKTINEKIAAKENGLTDPDVMTGVLGSMEYCDYLITLNDNIRIYIAGGQPHSFYFTNYEEVIREKAPNIVIGQSSSKYTPQTYAEYLCSYGAQLVMPLHQDGLSRSPIDCTPEQWLEQVGECAKQISPSTQFLNPKPLKWYTVSMSVVEE